MIYISRRVYDDSFLHVMVQGLNKEYIFQEDYYKEKYIKLIKKYIKKYDVLVLAYCIMGNHAHMLIYAKKAEELSKFMQNINSKFAIFYNKTTNRVGYVFRGRFNSQYINSNEYLLRCLNYIHMNPVNANIIKKPQNYKYSTYNDFINKTGIINDTVLEKLFGSTKNYLDIFLNISNKEIEIMDVDREEKNFEIATKIFLSKNNTTIDKIKNDINMMNKFCLEIVVNKKYKQAQAAKLLGVNVSTISRMINNKV